MKQLSAETLLHPNEPYYLNTTLEFGRGLYASRLIIPGDVVMLCELLVFSADDTVAVNQTELQFYTFKYNDKQDCLCLGLGEIFNHRDTANVSYELVEMYGRKLMCFKAAGFIMPGEQFFIDYAADTKVDPSEYIQTPSMMGGSNE